ncbi:MAG TPA: glycoside hydrolase domain-containing protein [Acidobacteriota bacterium]|jgi:hypothetical protein
MRRVAGRALILVGVLIAGSVTQKSLTGRQNNSREFEWIGSRVGITDKVLPPWTPLVIKTEQDERRSPAVDSVSISCWGRAYEFGSQPFLRQVYSAGRPLLAGPVNLSVRADNQILPWERTETRVLEATPALVRISQTASAGPLRLLANVQLEYDGAIRFDWSLQPQREIEIQELTFNIPLRRQYAKYLYNFPGGWSRKGTNAGLLPPQGYSGAFRPFIWLGDEERGLSWFSESDERWISSDRKRLIAVSARGDQVVLQLHLLDVPTRLGRAFGPITSSSRESLRYVFGFQATPVKPVTKDVWDFRIAHVEATYYGIQERLKIPNEKLDRLAAAGVRTIAFHEHWTDVESYVTTTYGDDLARLVNSCHARGIDLLLYFGFLVSDLAPEWPRLGAQCVVMPREGYEPYDYPPQPKQNAYRVCYNSVWQDRIAVGIADVMDRYHIDGVYLDGTEYVWPCANRAHGCGYARPDGSVAPTYPFWAVRNMMKRIYTIVKTRKPEGQINVHNSTCMTIPTLGWATSYWDGEQFRDLPVQSASTALIPLDVFRTEFMGHQWGVPAEFMSFEEEKKTLFHFREAHAFTLLHDVLGGRSWRIGPSLDLASSLWRLSDDFGRKSAEWLPYWRNSAYVTVEPGEVYTSLYRHPKNGLLAVVSNLGRTEASAAVRFNLQKLRLKRNLLIRDALSGEDLSIEDGLVKLSLRPMQWKILWARERP